VSIKLEKFLPDGLVLFILSAIGPSRGNSLHGL